jgi:hypothetical protein
MNCLASEIQIELIAAGFLSFVVQVGGRLILHAICGTKARQDDTRGGASKQRQNRPEN